MRDEHVNVRLQRASAIRVSAPPILLFSILLALSFILSSLYYSNQCFLQELELGFVKPIKNSVRIFPNFLSESQGTRYSDTDFLLTLEK